MTDVFHTVCRTAFKKIWPDSLAKQISLALLASIVLLFVVNMGVVSIIQTRFLSLLEKERSANIASIYMLLSGMDNAQCDAGLERLTSLQSGSRNALNFHLIQESPAWADTGLAEQATATLQAILTENKVTPLPEIRARIFMEGDDFQVDAWARQVSGSAPVCSNPLLQLGVRLDGENWLNITQPLYQSAAWLIWMQRLVFLAEFATFAVLVLVLLRKLLKPFQQLTAAADHIGKQPEFCSPLPEEGCKEIREAAQSLNRMQARIQENLAERNRMLAAMAHDLRTPLTRVQLRLEEVEPEDLRDKLTAGIKEVRSIAEQSLELSGSLKVSEKFVPLDIVAFMQSCVDDFSDMGHNVTLGSAPVGSGNTLAVMARPLSLKRCVDNILRNAMAYAGNTGNIGDTGRAEVRITCSKGDVIVDICDNGPGIPEDCLEKIFEPYFRLETSRNRESGGTGLGLSIARNMILLNNGTLTLFNRPEGGLCARITLPRLERA